MQILDVYSGNHFDMTDLPMDANLKELYQAIWKGSLKKAKKAIRNDIKRNGKYTFSDDVLMQSIASGHEGIAKLMIKSGADVNSISPSGYSALMVALEHKMPGLANYLIMKGANINHMDKAGHTPFHCAIRKGLKDMAYKLALEIADPNIQDECNKTPLLYAVYYDAGDIVDILLDKGADVNISDTMGVSPLMLSINNRVMMVLDHVYRNNLHNHDPSIDWLSNYLPDFDGQNIEIVEKLLDKGAKLHRKEGFGNNALMLAVISGNLEVVKMLIERGAEVDATDNAGATALIKAIKKEHLVIAEYLLQRGADSNKEKFNKAVALHYAVQNENLDLVDLLLRHGADVNAKDVEGVSPFKVAVLEQWLEGIQHLLKYVVDINEKDREGWTPSDCAHANGFHEIAKLLKSHGGKANKTSFDHFEIFCGVDGSMVVNDHAYAYRIKPIKNNEVIILGLALGFNRDHGDEPILRKMIISCSNSEVTKVYCADGDSWFHRAKFADGLIVEETKFADENESGILIPRDTIPSGHEIIPDENYENDFKSLSHSFFSYIDYNDTFNNGKPNGGKLTLTPFGKDKLEDSMYYGTSFSNRKFGNIVTETSKLYIK